ncbi:hypothetical protein B0T26DRAFT_681333 [Lasiosphaeria miniovina]|uniref:Uncharacterized protein n=1 Tax=Lasiosphaeria miniovina TaxID=1954250 RepID=A0AA39ZUB3_9PEZI|nr:uncharacterized protein B0T26DRAFT_681333 [Lasiosphaeria miniovina]KAK0703689.1 hypothetical protein B0T26DRAFT_681333 [Lasiosphaeria miniovina]
MAETSLRKNVLAKTVPTASSSQQSQEVSALYRTWPHVAGLKAAKKQVPAIPIIYDPENSKQVAALVAALGRQLSKTPKHGSAVGHFDDKAPPDAEQVTFELVTISERGRVKNAMATAQLKRVEVDKEVKAGLQLPSNPPTPAPSRPHTPATDK